MVKHSAAVCHLKNERNIASTSEAVVRIKWIHKYEMLRTVLGT